jgi:hypothetical protein
MGREIFFFRDLGTTHIPLRSVRAVIGSAHLNPFASFGEPYLGNPNALAAYPFPSGERWIGVHVLSHIFLAFAGMMVLLWILGLAADAAFFGATSFALSGYVLSAASSLNAITSIAWMPWFLAASVALRRGRRPWLAGLALLPIAGILSVAGEPVLIGITIVLGLGMAGLRRLSVALASTAAGWALFFPVHRATFQAMAESYRVRTGYSFEEAMSASLHPARLLETVFPYIFGDPSRIGAGTYWGYGISNDAAPYIYSVALGALAVSCAAAALHAGRWRARRGWLGLALVSLILSMGSFVPGSHFAYDHAGALHSVRFPIKLLLVCTLALSVLAAYGFERLLVERDAATRRFARMSWTAAGIFVLGAFIAAAGKQGLENLLVRLWWDARWPSAPHDVLAPIVDAFPERLLALACMAAALAWAASAKRRAVASLTLQLLLVSDLLASGRHLFPTVSRAVYDARSPLVEALLNEHGPVFERAAKDLDPVRGIMRGEYPSNDVRWLGIAESRQAWALSGARFGLRYAYDSSSDGSYRDRVVKLTNILDRDAWPVRLKWLRAAGVTTVVTSDVPPRALGLVPIAREERIGVPVAAYAVTGHLSEFRRLGDIRWVTTFDEAVRAFEMPAFDPARSVILEGPARFPRGVPGLATLVRGGSDQLTIDTEGVTPAVLIIARAYSSSARATVNGIATAVFPANAHLCGILVPEGRARVILDF